MEDLLGIWRCIAGLLLICRFVADLRLNLDLFV